MQFWMKRMGVSLKRHGNKCNEKNIARLLQKVNLQKIMICSTIFFLTPSPLMYSIFLYLFILMHSIFLYLYILMHSIFLYLFILIHSIFLYRLTLQHSIFLYFKKALKYTIFHVFLTLILPVV